MVQTMLLSNWGQAFVDLFTKEYNIIAMVCLAIGLVFAAIECFIPGFGIFGIMSIVFCAFSVILTLVMGGENAWIQFLYMVGMGGIILTIIVLIAIHSARYGLLSKSSLIQNKTALPKDFADVDKQKLASLKGKIGVTETICKPSGKVNIEGQTYDVLTNGEFIPKNSEVYVAEVENSTIIVKKR